MKSEKLKGNWRQFLVLNLIIWKHMSVAVFQFVQNTRKNKATAPSQTTTNVKKLETNLLAIEISQVSS
jgi:hypothetical protein